MEFLRYEYERHTSEGVRYDTSQSLEQGPGRLKEGCGMYFKNGLFTIDGLGAKFMAWYMNGHI